MEVDDNNLRLNFIVLQISIIYEVGDVTVRNTLNEYSDFSVWVITFVFNNLLNSFILCTMEIRMSPFSSMKLHT